MSRRTDRKSTPRPSPVRPARAARAGGAGTPPLPPAQARAKARSPKSAPKPAAKGPERPRPTPVRGPKAVPPRQATREGPGPVAIPPDVSHAKAQASASAMRWSLVTARDLMRHNVVTVAKNTPLPELEKILADNRITGAPVVDAKGTIVGVVSMRDLIDHYSEGGDSTPRREPTWFEVPFEHVLEDEDDAPVDVPTDSGETVEDIMTAEVVSVPADAGIREIARTMTERKVHRVLVERDVGSRVYVGILGTFEILDMLAE